MSSNLSTRLESRFSKNVRRRGEEYYWGQKVRIERASETELHARVRGSLTYEVDLTFRDGTLSVWCDCPCFEDNGVPCKHLWATILAAEAQSGLSAAASAAQLVLRNEAELPFDDAHFKTLNTNWRASVARPRAPVPPRQWVPRPPSWQQQFKEIVAPGSLPSESAWPAKREVLYVVDIATSLSRGGLCLTLESRDRKKDGSWGQRAEDRSAKLEALLAQLREVLDEGHKALVFSQFTSLLKIVRQRLDESGVVYEYLDGATRDRQARVERFQTDPTCKIFLISLKAGGVGLNLTAAEYVFILDPWWNPAVEAQAVDRTHRIGQQRPVFAYRLIARDTVEEKILELQKSKRDLAAEIIGAESSVIRNLKAEDLALLLS